MSTATVARKQPAASRSAKPRARGTNAQDQRWTKEVREILNRQPAVGLAVAVVGDDGAQFICHGHADIASGTPITEDTVFRIGSIAKTITAIAIMQLWEEGRVDLDAPADAYLRAYRLVPRQRGFPPPTLRQLLTHTSGIPEARHFVDLLHFSWGPWDGRPPIHSVPFGDRLPSLAEYYRDGLKVVVEPGSAFAYSNHGFATLGQVVEDVSGLPLGRYLRERIFDPLGMRDTDLMRSPRIAARLATGYAFSRTGPRPVPDRDWIGGGFGGVYSTARDLARYAAALLHGGRIEGGSVLEASTLALMFDPHYQTDPGLPAMGLAFFLTAVGGHRVASHDGILPGFNSHLSVAPDDGVGVICLTNGSSGAMRWIPGEMEWLLGGVLGVAPPPPRADIPHHPEVWEEISGRYVLPPRIGDLRGRLAMGGGLEVYVRGGRPMLRLRLPVPALYRGVPLQPDDVDDPRAFCVDLAGLGMGQVRLRFRRQADSSRKVLHTDLGGQPISFEEALASGRSRLRLAAGAGVVAAGAVAFARRRAAARR